MADGAGAREDERGKEIEPVEGETDTPLFSSLRTDPIIEGQEDFPPSAERSEDELRRLP